MKSCLIYVVFFGIACVAISSYASEGEKPGCSFGAAKALTGIIGVSAVSTGALPLLRVVLDQSVSVQTKQALMMGAYVSGTTYCSGLIAIKLILNESNRIGRLSNRSSADQAFYNDVSGPNMRIYINRAHKGEVAGILMGVVAAALYYGR